MLAISFCPVTDSVERRICLPFTGTEECVDEIEDHDTQFFFVEAANVDVDVVVAVENTNCCSREDADVNKLLTVLTKLNDVEAVVIAMLTEFFPTEVVLIVAVFRVVDVEVVIVVAVAVVVVVRESLLSAATVVVVVLTA